MITFEHKVCAEAVINCNGMNLGNRPIFTKALVPSRPSLPSNLHLSTTTPSSIHRTGQGVRFDLSDDSDGSHRSQRPLPQVPYGPIPSSIKIPAKDQEIFLGKKFSSVLDLGTIGDQIKNVKHTPGTKLNPMSEAFIPGHGDSDGTATSQEFGSSSSAGSHGSRLWCQSQAETGLALLINRDDLSKPSSWVSNTFARKIPSTPFSRQTHRDHNLLHTFFKRSTVLRLRSIISRDTFSCATTPNQQLHVRSRFTTQHQFTFNLSYANPLFNDSTPLHTLLLQYMRFRITALYFSAFFSPYSAQHTSTLLRWDMVSPSECIRMACRSFYASVVLYSFNLACLWSGVNELRLEWRRGSLPFERCRSKCSTSCISRV